MRDDDYLMMLKYRKMFPEESETLSRALRVCSRHQMTDLFRNLLDEAIDSGLRIDWAPVFSMASDTKYQGLYKEDFRQKPMRSNRWN